MRPTLLILTALIAATAHAQPLPPAIPAFLQKNCQTCHNPSLPSGNVDLEQLLNQPNTLTAARDTWQNIASVLRSRAMPPPTAPQPADNDREAAVALISGSLSNREAGASGSNREAGASGSDREAGASNREAGVQTPNFQTFNYDPERTGWYRGPTTLSRETVPQLHLLWRYQTDADPGPINKYSTLTDPLVVGKLVFVASAENNVYAIDAEKGTLVWKRAYPNTARPPVATNNSCPNNLNATPVVDPAAGILYFLPNDGKLRGVSLSNGEDRFPATSIVPAFSRNFSLNLVDGIVYASTTRGCANAVSQVVGIDVNSPDRTVNHFFLSPGKGSGVWGRGGIVKSPYGVLAQTADGAYDPASGRWGDSIVEFNRNMTVIDSYTPADQPDIDARDFDLGSSSPVVFPFAGRTLVAVSAKESRIYLLDAKNLGGPDHRTPLYRSERWANDALAYGFNGMWSVMSTYVDATGRRWLLAPMYGPPAQSTVGLFKKQHGKVINGSLMAFTVEERDGKPYLNPQWISGDLDLPGVAVTANGVIFILANGDRGSTVVRTTVAPRGPGRGAGPRALPLTEVNPAQPNYERDAAWRAAQLKPFEEGGQKPGQRYTGGRDTTHAVLYAMDPETGDELYSSGDSIDSWNHYGGLSLSNDTIYISTYAGRLYAFSEPRP